jgi:hypothetical protein
MRLKILFSVIALIAVSFGWLAVRTKGARLDAELLAARDRQRELASLKVENDRLRAQTPDPARVSAANRALLEAASLQKEIVKREEAPRPAPFSTGEWTGAANWTNRGVDTPRAALETALWAAAGGDISTFSSMLEFDGPALAKANDLLAKLPIASRQNFPNAESLIASVTLGRIPLAEAQVAWFHANDDNHASAALLLHGTENLPSSARPPLSANDDPANRPPMGRENPGTHLATLSLHRSGSGWRLVVPAAAIDRLGRDLLASTK